jgi:FixJ family two-component response regulator
MAVSTSIVFVVGDDISVRESLEFLLRNEGWQAEDRPPSKFNLSQPVARSTSFS